MVRAYYRVRYRHGTVASVHDLSHIHYTAKVAGVPFEEQKISRRRKYYYNSNLLLLSD